MTNIYGIKGELMKNLLKAICISVMMISCGGTETSATSGTTDTGSTLTCLSLTGSSDFDEIGREDDKLVCLDNNCILENGCGYNDATTTINGNTYKLEVSTSSSDVEYFKAELSLETDTGGGFQSCDFNGNSFLHGELVSQTRWDSDVAPCTSREFTAICQDGTLEFDIADGFTFDMPCSDSTGPCSNKDAGVVVDKDGNELSSDMKNMFIESMVVDLTAPSVNDCEIEDNKSYPNGSFQCLGEDRGEEITNAQESCQEFIRVIKNGHNLVDLSSGETKLNLLTELLKNANAYSYHTESDLQVKLIDKNLDGDSVNNSGITQSGNEVSINVAMVEAAERVSDQRVLTIYFKLENMSSGQDYRESSAAELKVKLPAKANADVDMIKKVTGLTLEKDKDELKFKISEGHQINPKWENVRFELVLESIMTEDLKYSDNTQKAQYLVNQLVDDADNYEVLLSRPEDNDVLETSTVSVAFKVYGIDKTDPDNMEESIIGENIAEIDVENKDCADVAHGMKIKDSDLFFYKLENSYAICDDISQPAVVYCQNAREDLRSSDASIYKFATCNSWEEDLSKHDLLETNSSAHDTLNVKDAQEGDDYAVAINDLVELVKVESNNSKVLADFSEQLTNMEVKLTRLQTSWGSPSASELSDYAVLEKSGDKYQLQLNTLKLKQELGMDLTKTGALNFELSISYENMNGERVTLDEVLKVESGLKFTQE